MDPRASSRRALGRLLAALVAAAFVALVAPACPPAPESATPADVTTTTTTTSTPGTPRATIKHCPVVGFTYGNGFGPLAGGGYHYGIDMVAPLGTPVYAVRSGTLW